ncbi:FxsB family radical SAM/SPASM domain protein [Actinospica durhamensis]|uniref:FxsB family radical SAM/SPASM domain protein n=1 Tax=Actinospica durhamensis TaxID=1508375 RepID=A0A941IRH4_9ACTN|nr:FxsB family cyclophane-forming radical SAM/SPASM peptide maturase [Actinospica durhamensis]MBR7833938.1 FxsB family radical SAM/SPASM domain protein [Actinospica durhamensis]
MPARSAAFRQFVVKVHSRCDLACDHCYVYEAADQGWRAQPRVMSRATAEALGRRIAEHAAAARLDLVRVVLHGGEPLLAGPARLGEIIEALCDPVRRLPDPPRLDLRVHSNGVRLDRAFCELFARHRVTVGISLDGDRAANDLHRRYADGRSSHAQVRAALALLRSEPYRRLYAGILCTVDLRNDPVEVYRALASEQPPRIDLLLPHATWDTPPPRPDGLARPSTAQDPAYAHWLLRVYEAWDGDGRPFGIRVFDSIRSTLHGGPPLTEALGLAPSDVLVVETDGAIEQADSLKVAFDGAAGTGLNVHRDPLAAAGAHAGIIARQSGSAALSPQCQACPALASCGGGLYAHRYRAADARAEDPAAAFRNPTVYCADLLHLVAALREREERAAPMVRHALHSDLFDQLAAGYGDAEALRQLGAGQASVNRTLLAEAGRVLAQQSPEGSRAWELLLALDAAHPAAVAEAVAHPFFRPWALDVLDDPIAAHPAPLAGYALVAASLAGTQAALPLPPDRTALILPGIGRIVVTDGVAELGPGGVARNLSAEARYLGDGLARPRILLEDLDPSRDRFQLPAAPRLTEDELARWHAAYAEAWAFVERLYPDYAPALATALRALVPLPASADGHAVSGTARQAFGALGLARPQDPRVLALLLIHEFQHVKLGAVLDLYDLYDDADTRLYYAPWREDPRPLEGLLQGTYAHVAVIDYWLRRVRAGDADAHTPFARWRAQTWAALDTLDASGSLTALGSRFTAGLRATMTPWLAVPVPAEALEAAAREGAEHHAAFAASAHTGRHMDTHSDTCSDAGPRR